MLHSMIFRSVLLLLACIACKKVILAENGTGNDDSWSFIVLADWHGAESFAAKPVTDRTPDDDAISGGYTASIEVLSHIKNNYGGDLVLLPGDTNSGKWYEKKFIERLSADHGKSLTSNEAIAIGANNCYSTTKRVFRKAGYDKILLAVGDHEIGDNPWMKGTPVVDGLPVYRDAIANQLNRDDNGTFLYDKPIGEVPSRPIGTIYENTSYAHVHKNVLFVTVDVFHVGNDNHFNRAEMTGGEGIVSGNVEGEHLTWFEDIINTGCANSAIKHIFVQSHLPILEPVRKINSSSMPFDKGTDNKFWEIMQQCVDVYFAGEVHALTATKDRDSNLVQIVSRGNRFSNFIKVDVSDDKLIIEAYNEVGELWRWNKNYIKYGELTIDKSDKSNDENLVIGSGALTLLDIWGTRPLIYFRFEEKDKYLLKNRQILGLKYDDYKDRLIGTKRTIRGEMTTEGIENHGTFGRQYDAQIANLDFDTNSVVDGSSSGIFHSNTVVAVGSMGPFVAGEIFFFSLFFKTSQTGESVLVSFGSAWGGSGAKDMLLLTLKGGVPILYTNEETSLRPFLSKVALNDGSWHQILVRMPFKSCKLSEVLIDIDGHEVDTIVEGIDQHIFFKTTSYLTLGGWGYSHEDYGDTIFSSVENFVGSMDRFMVRVGKEISTNDIAQASKRKFTVYSNMPCLWEKNGRDRDYKGIGSRKKCSKKCIRSSLCRGYMIMPSKKRIGQFSCYHFPLHPKPNERKTVDGSECAIFV